MKNGILIQIIQTCKTCRTLLIFQKFSKRVEGQGPANTDISTDFGADSSSRYPSRAETSRQADR